MTAAVLRVQDLHWSKPGANGGLPGTPVLRGAGLEVHAGELVALEGASGTGKTVLCTHLLRLREPPQKGSIFWGDQDVTGWPHRRLRPLRRAFQGMLQHTGAILPPFLTVGDALRETARYVARTPDPERLVHEMVQALGIQRLLPRRPRHLSGGEQRLAGLARILLNQPDFAFFDEPDAGLDPPSQLEILRQIRRAAEVGGTGILLVTHNAGLARQHADRRLRLQEGRIHAI